MGPHSERHRHLEARLEEAIGRLRGWVLTYPPWSSMAHREPPRRVTGAERPPEL